MTVNSLSVMGDDVGGDGNDDDDVYLDGEQCGGHDGHFTFGHGW